MAARAFVIVVDDEAGFAEALAEYLSALDLEVAIAGDAATLVRLAAERAPDLAILDLGLPDADGGSLIRQLKAGGAAVLVCSGADDRLNRILCLELGADDFVAKPAPLRELRARAAALLARRGRMRQETLRLERATADLARALVLHDDGAEERLSPGEVALLRLLARHPGRVFSRAELIEAAPAEDRDAFDRAIDARIARLRRKLDTEAIETRRGQGYTLTPPPLRRTVGDD